MIQQSSIVESAEWPPALKSSRLDCLESRQGLGLGAAQALPAYTEFKEEGIIQPRLEGSLR